MRRRLLITVLLLFPQALLANPQLSVVGRYLKDPGGHIVIIRGLASMGMGIVYGDKANQPNGKGTYMCDSPTNCLSVAQYVDAATQTDSTGNIWYARAIRLNFERFPSVDPGRLYRTENVPYAMPETIAISSWAASSPYTAGDLAASGGNRYQAVLKTWRSDRGTGYNGPPYAVGEYVVGIYPNPSPYTHIYVCASVTGSGPSNSMGTSPTGTGTGIPENEGGYQYTWNYVGEWGTSGTTAISSLTPVQDYSGNVATNWYIDGGVQWQYISPDYSPTTAAANFADWQSKVMTPAVNEAIANGLYVVICQFDFGTPIYPLNSARLLDFWPRSAAAYANNPNVMFELWNETEDIGPKADGTVYSGGFGTWAAQKSTIQSIITAIRNAGATNNIILVPTPLFSTGIKEATDSPLTGSNIAYSLHQYRSSWDAFGANRDQINGGLANNYPIIMTEWGDDTGDTNPLTQWPDADTPGGGCMDQGFSRPCPAVTLKQLLEPLYGSTAPAAGWFAWALTQNWFPDLYSDNILTMPTPFGVSTRVWLAATRNDSQPGASSPKRLRFMRIGALVVILPFALVLFWRRDT